MEVQLSKCQEGNLGRSTGRLLTSTYLCVFWLGMGFFCLLTGKIGKKNHKKPLWPLSSTCSQASAESSVESWPVLKAARCCTACWGLTAVPPSCLTLALWGDTVGTPLGDRKCGCQRPHPKCQGDLSEYWVLVWRGGGARGESGFYSFTILFVRRREAFLKNYINSFWQEIHVEVLNKF